MDLQWQNDMTQASYIVYPGLGGDVPTAMRIIGVTANIFDVTVEEMKSKTRKRAIADPRHVAFFVIRKRTGLSLKSTAGLLGREDHTTSGRAIKKVEDLACNDYAFAQKVKFILRQFDANSAETVATENRQL